MRKTDLRNRDLALSVIKRIGENRNGFRKVDPELVADVKRLLELEPEMAKEVHAELLEGEDTVHSFRGQEVQEIHWFGSILANWAESFPAFAKAVGLDPETRRGLVKVEALVPKDLVDCFSGPEAGRTCAGLGRAIEFGLRDFAIAFPGHVSNEEAFARVKGGAR